MGRLTFMSVKLPLFFFSSLCPIKLHDSIYGECALLCITGYCNFMTCEGATREHNNRNSLMVIKPSAATLSLLRPGRSTAINGREMKVYEIIDARLKGRQLCETQGGSRKGLLIRRVWFGVSVKRQCSKIL